MSLIHHELKKYFIIGIKSNRCIALTATDAKNGRFQQVTYLDWKDGDCKIVYQKDLSFPVKLLKKVFTNEDGSTGTLYLVTIIYTVYQKRWKIEVFHR